MTLEDYLKRQLARSERLFGPNDSVSKRLREQLASVQEGQPSTYLQFTVGARSFGGSNSHPEPSSLGNEPPPEEA